MRTSWLLVSIAVHGAAFAAALGVGLYRERHPSRPPARIAVDSREPSAAVEPRVVPVPDVQAEEPVVEQPLRQLTVVEPEPEPAPPAPRPVERSPIASPSAILEQAASLEPIRRRSPEPDVRPPEVPPPAPRPESVAQELVDAQRCDNTAPEYPERERRLGREGRVVLRVSVTADGGVADVALLEPSPFPAFNRAALRAARRWRFEPARRGGAAVASETDVEVVFRLTDGR